jgi:hypothetical protein
LQSFNDVILKCLSPQTFIPAGRSLQDETFRQQIYTEIVYPLEQILAIGYNINLEDEIALNLKLSSCSQSHAHDLPRNTPKSMCNASFELGTTHTETYGIGQSDSYTTVGTTDTDK